MNPGPLEEIHAYYCKHGQNSMTWEVIGLRAEFTISVLLNGHNSNLPCKYLCLYPQISAVLNTGQRSLLLQWAAMQRLINGQNAEIRCCWVLSPKWDTYQPASTRLGTRWHKGRKNRRARRCGVVLRNAFFWTTQGRCCPDEPTAAMVTWTRSTHDRVNIATGNSNWTQ